MSDDLEALAAELRDKLPPWYENPRELPEEPEGPRARPPSSVGEERVLVMRARAVPVITEALETLNTPGWQYLVQAFNRTIEERMERALQAKDPVELAELRGQVVAYREFLQLPSTLKQQAEQGHEAQLRLGSRPTTDTLEEGMT